MSTQDPAQDTGHDGGDSGGEAQREYARFHEETLKDQKRQTTLQAGDHHREQGNLSGSFPTPIVIAARCRCDWLRFGFQDF